MSQLARVFWLAALWLVWTATVHAQATFTPLGFFGGAADSEAHDVSADGSVVVGRATGFPDRIHGIFRWTRDESIVYKELARNKVAVSDDGSTIVGSRYLPQTTLDEAFRWIPSEELFEGLGDLPGGAFNSAAYDVSADGSVIVGSGNANGISTAFRWTSQSGMVPLVGRTLARGVSSDGNVVVGPDGRWTAETGWVELRPVPRGLPFAHAVSPDGAIVVGASDFPIRPGFASWEPFRWTQQDGAVVLAHSQIVALDVSADGLAIVGSGIGRSTGATAFYWTTQIGMAELQDVLIFGGATGLEGWRLTGASAISHDGRTVVGSGIDPSNRLQGFVATIGAVPEPSTFLLVAFAVVGLIGLKIRRVRSQ
jgi:uncharacterized membrane protein